MNRKNEVKHNKHDLLCFVTAVRWCSRFGFVVVCAWLEWAGKNWVKTAINTYVEFVVGAAIVNASNIINLTVAWLAVCFVWFLHFPHMVFCVHSQNAVFFFLHTCIAFSYFSKEQRAWLPILFCLLFSVLFKWTAMEVCSGFQNRLLFSLYFPLRSNRLHSLQNPTSKPSAIGHITLHLF